MAIDCDWKSANTGGKKNFKILRQELQQELSAKGHERTYWESQRGSFWTPELLIHYTRLLGLPQLDILNGVLFL